MLSSGSLRLREHISTSSKATFQAIGEIQKTLNSLTLEVDAQIDQTRCERLLQSLKFPGFNERRNQVSEAYERTFQWIFMGDDGPTQEDPTESDLEDSDWEDSDLEDIDLADPSQASWDLFSNWLSSTADIYWITGKPGSGKTTLVKYVLNHPKTATYLNIWSPQTLTISHFFWRPGNKMQQSIKGLLCSLLYQLLDNSVATTNYVLQYIQDQASGVKDADTDWSVPELRSVFLQILSFYEHPICIFIDGLDEVDPADGPLDLLDLVQQIPRRRNTKLCLASRPEPLLQGRLSAYPHLRLQDLTRGDLDRYARDHIKVTSAIDDEDTCNRSRSSNAPWGLIESIVYKAEGVFLWLVLAIKSANKGFAYGDTTDMIQERIECLPGDLAKLYKDMWDRASDDSPNAYRQTAALCFRLLLLNTPYNFYKLSVLQLMLASTSIADQLLDAIENPLHLVPEKIMLKECKDLERKLELYCFGLVESTQSSAIEKIPVVGWYGSQHSKLWSCYGQRHPKFIHRTASDFLLDTVEGKEILGHDDSSPSLLLFRWIKAQLATSQLYANTQTGDRSAVNGVENHAEAYVDFIWSDAGIGPCNPNLTRIMLYFERLCSSGQLLSGKINNRARFCGGVEFLKVAASICCHGSIWPVAKVKTLPTATASEILLNLCSAPIMPAMMSKSYPVEYRINTLLRQGADPNWRGTMFTPQGRSQGDYSQAKTPFTAYLTRFLVNIVFMMRFSQHRISEVLGNLHAFLSHSANLGTMLVVLFPHRHSLDRFSPKYEPINLGFHRANMSDSVIVSFSAHTILQAVLDYISKEFEHPRYREDARYGETMWLIASIQKGLDDWSKSVDDSVIGRFDPECIGRIDLSGDQFQQRKPVWYVPSKEGPAEIANELLNELGCSLLTEESSSPKRCTIISQLVQQMSWTIRAEGFDETWESLAELGILARVDCELHNMQGWVDEFQKQRSAGGSFADQVAVAQSYLGNLST